jgi:hypothetical protein
VLLLPLLLLFEPQHKRACRRLLKHLPMIDLGEVEVDSLLTHNTKILYKCSAVSSPHGLESCLLLIMLSEMCCTCA